MSAGTRHPLDGVRVKLARARAHLKTFEAHVRETVGPEPDRIPGEFDGNSGQYLFRAQREMRAPLVLSAISGDVVHTLYAALDYLAWELVAANGQTGTTRTAFPIFQNPGIHPDAQALIKRLQPFDRPNEAPPNDHPLTLLYELERRDKHQTLNLTTNAAQGRISGLPPRI